MFSDQGIRVNWMDYSGYLEYAQLLWPPFTHKVSIIDLILNEGPEGGREDMLRFGSTSTNHDGKALA